MKEMYFDYNNKLIPQDKRKFYYENDMMSMQSMKDYETRKQEDIINSQKISRLIQTKYTKLKESSKLIKSLKKLTNIFNFT